MDYKFNQDEQIKCPICGESANYREFPDVVRLVEQLEKYKKREIISELFVDENKKYRQMWESYRRDVIECSDTKTYYNIILPLEQKYFPKEAKQDKADEQVEN